MRKNELSWKIAEYISEISFRNLDHDSIDEIKKRVLDSIGVALVAFNERPYVIVRKLARKTKPVSKGSKLWGENYITIPEYATFANGVGVRFLDFNDTYLSKEALHPSDMIPAIIALAEDREIDGKQAVLSMIIAYEIATRLADAFSVRSVGIDHVTYITIGTAAGTAKLLELPVEKIYHAINLATNESLSLRQTRSGELSMWKGSTAANSARKGLLATLLAEEGFTGPSPVFEGEFGFFNVVSKQRFDIEKLGGVAGERFRVLKTSIKYWPVEYHAMSAVEATLKLRERIDPSEIKRIMIKTFTVCYKIIAKDPEKWDPKTRETADHSLPYIVARTLLDNYIWIESFSDEKILGRDVRELMKKMSIEIDPKYDEIYPEGIPNTIEIETLDGKIYSETSIYPKGHFKNPLTWDEVEKKFRRLTENILEESQIKELISKVRNIESLKDLRELTDIITIRSAVS